MAFDLDQYSRQAEEFCSELDREYHLHFSGRQAEYRVQEVYDRHRALFGRETIDELRGLADGGDGERARRASPLLELAVGGLLGLECVAEETEIAERQASLELELDGDRIPYRRAPLEQANEPDPGRREALAQGQLRLLDEHLNPLHREAHERTRTLVSELGWTSYAEMCARLSGIDLEALSAQAQGFLRATDPVYEAIVDPELIRSLGTPLAQTRRADLSRFFRAPALDAGFPPARLVESFARTMAGLGLDLDSQPNILFDTEDRPTKTPRAYCAPVHVPQEVHLVVPRIGGREDYAALFHEGGHAEHFANVDAALAPEFRRLGDNSVTESFAFLLEHLIERPAWHAEILGSPDGTAIESHARAMKLLYLRRYAAKLAYELELHGADPAPEAMPARYSELLGGATGVDWPSQTWLSDVDGGFYVACYLRAWALEARWRATLLARFGEGWFTEPAAGEWLTGLWRQGQRRRGDELAAAELGEELDLTALASEFA